MGEWQKPLEDQQGYPAGCYPPISVLSRLWGLLKDVVKCIEKILRVKWSILLLSNRFFLRCMYLSVSLCFNTNKIDHLTLCSWNKSSKRTKYVPKSHLNWQICIKFDKIWHFNVNFLFFGPLCLTKFVPRQFLDVKTFF